VNPAERLERAQARAADRLEAIIGADEWSMFDKSQLALMFSGYDLDGESIAEMTSNIADPYSEAMIHAATEAWRNAPDRRLGRDLLRRPVRRERRRDIARGGHGRAADRADGRRGEGNIRYLG
jgi:hypothetical protein